MPFTKPLHEARRQRGVLRSPAEQDYHMNLGTGNRFGIRLGNLAHLLAQMMVMTFMIISLYEVRSVHGFPAEVACCTDSIRLDLKTVDLP